jgi:hypothetical protein
MNTAEGFMQANCSVLSMWCVSALCGAWIETKSERSRRSRSETGSTPSAVILSSLTYGSYAMTWSPKALARRATARATFPNEMRPSVWPYSRGIRLSSGHPCPQLPDPINSSMRRRRRCVARSIVSV